MSGIPVGRNPYTRFVIDLEKGKETCKLGKSLRILQTLGITLTLTPPAGEA
jgi:hypothetical protein